MLEGPSMGYGFRGTRAETVGVSMDKGRECRPQYTTTHVMAAIRKKPLIVVNPHGNT